MKRVLSIFSVCIDVVALMSVWVSLIAVYGYFFIARFHLGEWPRPHQPDPSFVLPQFYLLDWVFWFAALATLLVPAVVLSALFKLVRRSGITSITGFALLSQGMLILSFFLDPGQVWDWYLD